MTKLTCKMRTNLNIQILNKINKWKKLMIKISSKMNPCQIIQKKLKKKKLLMKLKKMKWWTKPSKQRKKLKLNNNNYNKI